MTKLWTNLLNIGIEKGAHIVMTNTVHLFIESENKCKECYTNMTNTVYYFIEYKKIGKDLYTIMTNSVC